MLNKIKKSKKLILIVLFISIFLTFGTILFQSCKEDKIDPPKAAIFYSIVDKQVAFTILTTLGNLANAAGWLYNDGAGAVLAYAARLLNLEGRLGNVIAKFAVAFELGFVEPLICRVLVGEFRFAGIVSE